MVSFNEEIEAEDVGAIKPCGQLSAIDSAPTPYSTSPMQLLLCKLQLVEKLEKNYTDNEGNPCRNLLIFSFQKHAMISKEESQWLTD